MGRPFGSGLKPLVCRECGNDDVESLRKRKTGVIDRICESCCKQRSRDRRADPRVREDEQIKRDLHRAANREKVNQTQVDSIRRRRADPLPMGRMVGQAVKAWRRANKVSQERLARVLGLCRSSIEKREYGVNPWRPDELRALVALGIEW